MSTRGKIITFGEILVEIVADTVGVGFQETMGLRGPFPSGAPAIFIDQVAHLNVPCGIISCVGDDDFGRLNIARLERDGVDVSAIAFSPNLTTGSAFVRYRPDGSRDFVYNIRGGACSETRLTAAAHHLLDQTEHFHLMGSSLFSPIMIEEAMIAVQKVREKGGKVSFDPNIRKEMLCAPGMRGAMLNILKCCDLFLPSGNELVALTDATDEEGAIKEIFRLGVSEVILKKGGEGCVFFSRDQRIAVPAFMVAEVDPTGAGDCFGATYVACRYLGKSVETSLRYASASGALAVSVLGPMEGRADFAALDAFIGKKGVSV